MGIALPLALVAVVLLAAAVVVLRRRARPPRGAATPGDPRPAVAPPVGGLGGKVRSLFRAGAPDGATWEGLERVLLEADVGPRVARELVERVRRRWREGADPEELLREEVEAILGPDQPLRLAGDRLSVVLVVGVNGSGKTTTIGKLAARLASEGKRVSLAAADTFRAAAAEQLAAWAERVGAHLVAQQRGADPGAVAFDAVKAALARGSDVLIIDTAGRLHTKSPLMDELAKVRRVVGKAGGTIDETLLVLDATTGQNGIAQARAFTEAVEVTGVALAKLDGTAKGGIVLAVREELGVPVKLVGTGEGPADLEAFHARAFAERLVQGRAG
jgi:fused signal recognition particle receptor